MELNVGRKASRSNTLAYDDVKTYAETTGDYNPLHFDENFAAKTRFKEPVVQGGLTPGYWTHWWPWTCLAQARFS